MEAQGRDGGLEHSWSYRRRQAAGSSSSSGTVSTTYGYDTSRSSASRLSSMSMEAALHLDMDMETYWMQTHGGEEDMPYGKETEEDPEFDQQSKKSRRGTDKDSSFKEGMEKRQITHIKSLVQEFFAAQSIDGGDGDMSVLERWLEQLGVGWVVHVAADDASLGILVHTFDAPSWVRALAEITATIRLMASPSPDHQVSVSLPSICEQEPEAESSSQQGSGGSSINDQLQFAQFIQTTMLKMLSFVDVIYVPNAMRGWGTLNTLLTVRNGLSGALQKIRLSFRSPPSAQVERIQEEILGLLSAKDDKAAEVIWSTMQQIWTSILELMDSDDGLSGTPTMLGSSDIHKATRSVMSYIWFLHKNYFSVAPVVSEAARLGKYVPHINATKAIPLTSLVGMMVHSLEEKLITKSESFLDEDAKFLFLLNNSNFVRKQLSYPISPLQDGTGIHKHKVEGYMDSYIQVSWVPMLSCLFNPTATCFGMNYSPLSKFESEFQKILPKS